MVLEEEFSKIESAAAPAISTLVRNGVIGSRETLADIVRFIALQAVRVPPRLQQADDMQQQITDFVYSRLGDTPASRKTVESLLHPFASVQFERAASKVHLHRNARMLFSITGYKQLFTILMQRNWVVLRSPNRQADFICSDDPVLLHWTRVVSRHLSPGFAMEHTRVFVPMGPGVALLGVWGAPPYDYELSQRQVAQFNGELVSQASRFLFFRNDFEVLNNSREVERSSAVLLKWKGRGPERSASLTPTEPGA